MLTKTKTDTTIAVTTDDRDMIEQAGDDILKSAGKPKKNDLAAPKAWTMGGQVD